MRSPLSGLRRGRPIHSRRIPHWALCCNPLWSPESVSGVFFFLLPYHCSGMYFNLVYFVYGIRCTSAVLFFLRVFYCWHGSVSIACERPFADHIYSPDCDIRNILQLDCPLQVRLHPERFSLFHICGGNQGIQTSQDEAHEGKKRKGVFSL